MGIAATCTRRESVKVACGRPRVEGEAGAAAAGGVGFSRKPFTAGPGSSIRIDVDVLRGHALTPGGRSDAVIIR